MTVTAAGSQVVLLSSDDGVQEELLIPPLMLVLEDQEVPAPGVVQVGDVIVGAAEHHLNLQSISTEGANRVSQAIGNA